ncbi:LysM domain protein, partial [Enterococcus faecalis TX1467]
SGDSLWGLSMQYGISIQKIKQLNGLSGDTIYIGQTLKVG